MIISEEADHETQTDRGQRLRTRTRCGSWRSAQRLPRRCSGCFDCDRETGERPYGPAFLYGDFANFDLAYAVTTHSQQGRTVTTCTALVNGTEDRHWLYTAMTRGRLWNRAIVMTSPAKIADTRQGTRAAPELERYERIERGARRRTGRRRRSGTRRDERRGPGSAGDSRGRPGQRGRGDCPRAELPGASLANADHLANLYARWQGETQDATRSRYERELRAALPPGHAGRAAERHGHVAVAHLAGRGGGRAGSEQLVRDADRQQSADRRAGRRGGR